VERGVRLATVAAEDRQQKSMKDSQRQAFAPFSPCSLFTSLRQF
jgi:hypothetical protein